MIHPIFSTLLGRPDLVADHLSGYAALAKEEASAAIRGVVVRAVAAVVALVCALLTLVLTGVALMLGGLHGFHWVLLAVPGAAALLAAVAALVMLRSNQMQSFAELRSQFDADVHMLKMAGRNAND